VKDQATHRRSALTDIKYVAFDGHQFLGTWQIPHFARLISLLGLDRAKLVPSQLRAGFAYFCQ
jgi:hypothetical protein